MIQRGEKKGTKDEPHFVLKIDMYTEEDKNVISTFNFDVYAETEKEAQEIVNEYLRQITFKFGLYEVKR